MPELVTVLCQYCGHPYTSSVEVQMDRERGRSAEAKYCSGACEEKAEGPSSSFRWEDYI